jgi:hypothetical protein
VLHLFRGGYHPPPLPLATTYPEGKKGDAGWTWESPSGIDRQFSTTAGVVTRDIGPIRDMLRTRCVTVVTLVTLIRRVSEPADGGL